MSATTEEFSVLARHFSLRIKSPLLGQKFACQVELKLTAQSANLRFRLPVLPESAAAYIVGTVLHKAV